MPTRQTVEGIGKHTNHENDSCLPLCTFSERMSIFDFSADAMHPESEGATMAKRIVKWTRDNAILHMAKSLEDPKATAEILADFDLTKLFPTFLEMNDVQKELVVYGTKQKLMDVGASEIAEVAGKVEAAKKKWDELLAGKWSGDRVNSTGAAENKRILAEVKDGAKAETLQGLMLKKLAFPTTFTEADEAKLQSFLLEVAKQAAKTGKAGK